MSNETYDEKKHCCCLVKKIKVINDSDFKIKLIFTEKEKDKPNTEECECALIVNAHEKEDKSFTILGFGKGKKITKIRYKILSDKENFTDILLTWEHPSHEVTIDMENISPKVNFDIRKDPEHDKVLLITIKNITIEPKV